MANKLCTKCHGFGCQHCEDGIVEYTQRKAMTHKEADLHLKFCKWVKSNYPNFEFVRHEKERKRSNFLQSVHKVYNTADSLPDFELLEVSGLNNRLYIEFKRPSENWLMADGISIKTEYAHQYLYHQKLWERGSCVYFCNDLEVAKDLLISYVAGKPCARQLYNVRLTKQEIALNNFPFAIPTTIL